MFAGVTTVLQCSCVDVHVCVRRYMGGTRWFRGKVMGRNADGSYDILYKDGDREQRVKESFIRPWTVAGAAAASANSPRRGSGSPLSRTARSVPTSHSLRKTATTRAATRRASGSRSSPHRRHSLSDSNFDDEFSNSARVSPRSSPRRGSPRSHETLKVCHQFNEAANVDNALTPNLPCLFHRVAPPQLSENQQRN